MELTFEEREQKVKNLLAKYLKSFDGMTQDYVKLIMEHHKVVTAGVESSLQVVNSSWHVF